LERIDQEPPPIDRCKDSGQVDCQRVASQRNLIKAPTGLPCSLKSGKLRRQSAAGEDFFLGFVSGD